jgi:hypothetical protein
VRREGVVREQQTRDRAAARAGKLDGGSAGREEGMNKHVFRMGMGIAIVALAFVGSDALINALLWEPGVTEANVRRVRPCMKPAEVEAILGKPAQLGAVTSTSGLSMTSWKWKGVAGEVVITFTGPQDDFVEIISWIPTEEAAARRRAEGRWTRLDPGAVVLTAEFQRRALGHPLPERLHRWLGW